MKKIFLALITFCLTFVINGCSFLGGNDFSEQSSNSTDISMDSGDSSIYPDLENSSDSNQPDDSVIPDDSSTPDDSQEPIIPSEPEDNSMPSEPSGSSDDEIEDDETRKTWKIATATGDLDAGSGFTTDAQKIRGLYEAGFRYIDFTMYSFTADCVYMQSGWRDEVLKLKTLADDLGMQFVQAHSQGGNALSSNSQEREFIVEATIRSIEICEVLGIENTVVHAGWTSGTKAQWFEANKEFYERLLPTAERCGVNILCENSTGANYHINTGADMRAFIEYVDHPNFHGCWDTGHANIAFFSQYSEIIALGDEMYAIHYQDNLGTSDAHLLPFCGTMDHNEVLQALIDIDYQGYFTLECDGGGRGAATYTGPEFDWMREAYPNVALSNIPSRMTRMEQEKLLYQLAEYIINTYPNAEMNKDTADTGFEILSQAKSYTDHFHGRVSGVVATDDTITISATQAESAFRGFMLKKGAIDTLVDIGCKTMEFKLTTAAPYFCFYSNDLGYVINKADIVATDGNDIYFASGSIVKIDLLALQSVATEGVALKFVATAQAKWVAYNADVNFILSDFVFNDKELDSEQPDDSTGKLGLEVMANTNAYTDHFHGRVTSVVELEGIVTISTIPAESKFRGFMLKKSAIDALVEAGYKTMEFKVTTASPYFCFYSNGVGFVINESAVVAYDGNDTYFASGTTIKIDLLALQSVATDAVALKFVATSRAEWVAYESDLNFVLSNFVFYS